METLTSSASKIILDKYRHRCFFYSKEFYVNRPQVMFLPSKKHVNGRSLELLSVKHKAVQTISSVPADSQAELETAAQDQIYQSKTVHVKFQLQKGCQFGEQFLIVGDDPMFGLWDPESAIPLDWSDEHVWTVELDVPVGKSIQFKFILKDITGDILWQPGRDRTFETWETKNTITIYEDWENAEYQKIIEEEPMANQSQKPAFKSEIIFSDDFIEPKKELIFDVSNTLDAVDGNMNLGLIPQKPLEETYVANKGMMIAEDILGHNSRAATVKKQASTNNEGNLITFEGDPILVPGLTSLATVSTEGDIQVDNESGGAGDALLGINEAKNLSLPELDEKQEPENDQHQMKKMEEFSDIKAFNHEEQQLDDEVKQMPRFGKEEQQSEAKPSESDVLQNDIQWGRRTLQMFLNNLGLL